MSANWYDVQVGRRPLPTDQIAIGALTAWTCRPGRNRRPGRRWRLNAIGQHGTVRFRPARSILRKGATDA